MCGENKPNISFQDCIEIGNASQSGQKILITSHVFDSLSSPDNLNHEQPTKCLLLLGTFEGENGIIILDTMPFNLTIDENGQYKLSKKKFRSLCNKALNKFPDLQIVGWCTVSNPSDNDLLPSYAVSIHRKFFRYFRETLLLIDPVSSQLSIFEWSGINLKPSTGYYYTNNNDSPKLIFKMQQIENKVPALVVSINENSILPEKSIEVNTNINIIDTDFKNNDDIKQNKHKKSKLHYIIPITIFLFILVIISIFIILSIIN